MYKNNLNNKNKSINKTALLLSFFVHIILLLFLFWNIQWKNNKQHLTTMEVEIYNEIPGNAATYKQNKGYTPKNENLNTPLNSQKNNQNNVEKPKKITQNLVENSKNLPPPAKVITNNNNTNNTNNIKADIELQRKKQLELEKIEKQKQKEIQKEIQKEKQKQEQLKQQKLAEEKIKKDNAEKEKLLKKSNEVKPKENKPQHKTEIKKDNTKKFDFGDELAAENSNIKNLKNAVASDKNRSGNTTDKTRGGVGNVTGKNVAGNTMKKVKQHNLDAYIAKIQNIVRSKVVLPPNVEGNPEMLLKVRQSQNGTILSVKIVKSSGNDLLDKAVEKAFFKSSPLPLPDDPEDFNSILDVKYKPF